MKKGSDILSVPQSQPFMASFYDNAALVALDDPICLFDAITINIHILEGSFIYILYSNFLYFLLQQVKQ